MMEGCSSVQKRSFVEKIIGKGVDKRFSGWASLIFEREHEKQVLFDALRLLRAGSHRCCATVRNDIVFEKKVGWYR
jgi:hypothetical protein